jgi:excisionase family DNA binding protein
MTERTPDYESLLTGRELAKRLRVSYSTVRRWTWSGLIPTHRIGYQHRYDVAEVVEALNRNRGGGRRRYG